jgi:hypothetical protein
MSRNDPTEVLVAVHLDLPRHNARKVSINGEGNRSVWIARSLTSSFHLTGKTTQGTDQEGKRLALPLANMTIPEWLAKDRGFI